MSDKNKTLKQLVAATSISLLSLTAAQAVVNLEVEDNIKVTVINGKEVNKSLFMPIKKQFDLEPGKHVITARYDRLYDLRSDEHDYLRSGNITVSVDLQDNQTYRLVMEGQPERYQEAREYVKSPTLAVMKGSNVVAKETLVKDEDGIFSSLSGVLGLGSSAQLDNQNAIAAVNSQPATPSVSAANNRSSAQADTLDRFMQLWLQATPQEREKIRQWVDK